MKNTVCLIGKVIRMKILVFYIFIIFSEFDRVCPSERFLDPPPPRPPLPPINFGHDEIKISIYLLLFRVWLG